MVRLTLHAFALSCLLCLAPLPCLAQLRVGSELQVNVYTTNDQLSPDVSLDASGDFVVAWHSYLQDGDDRGVFARRFNAAGVAQAAEFQVNTYTTTEQSFAALSLDADGDFVVAWTSYGQDGADDGIFARRFNAAGIAQASELQVNTHTLGKQTDPAVSLDPGGDFVVAWSSRFDGDGSDYGIFARRFSAAGIAQAVEFQVNTYTEGAQYGASVSLDADGDFVVAWGSAGQDGYNYGVFARRFNSAGTAQATEWQVNAHTTGIDQTPSVSLSASGDFVIVWDGYDTQGAPAVFARRFDSSGAAQATESQVNTYTAAGRPRSSVEADDEGAFVVAWVSALQDGSQSGISARAFDAAGNPRGAEFQVNTYTSGVQLSPSVSLDASGRFVVAWESQSQDGNGRGVFAQRLALLALLDIDGDGEASPLTDGLLALRFLFGFSGQVLVSGVVDLANCSRCDAAAIEAYLETLN